MAGCCPNAIYAMGLCKIDNLIKAKGDAAFSLVPRPSRKIVLEPTPPFLHLERNQHKTVEIPGLFIYLAECKIQGQQNRE